MVEDGHRAPLPDWVGYLVAAEEMHCSPRDLQRYENPDERWWMHKALIWREAKGMHAERERELQEAKHRQQQQGSGRLRR